MYKVWAWVNWMENLYAAWCTWKKDGLTFRRRAQNTDLTTSKTKTFILNEIEIHFLMKDNIFHIIICNSNYISMDKKNHKTAGLVRHKVHWTEAKITGHGPAVQRELPALLCIKGNLHRLWQIVEGPQQGTRWSCFLINTDWWDYTGYIVAPPGQIENNN